MPYALDMSVKWGSLSLVFQKDSWIKSTTLCVTTQIVFFGRSLLAVTISGSNGVRYNFARKQKRKPMDTF
jgi:hypothetical protein